MEKYLMDCWPGENHLEDAITWGVDPLFQLNEILDSINEEGSGTTKEQDVFFYYDRKSKLNNLKDVLYRYDLFQMLLERRLKELAPDDPLVVDTVNQVKKEVEEREKAAAAREAARQEKNETFKRLCKLADENNLTDDVFHKLLEVVIQKAEKMEQKKQLIKKISAFTEAEAQQLFDVVAAIQGAKKENLTAPKAEKQASAA